MGGPWLPMELCVKIIENVFDPSDLLTFRLVNRAWNEAVSKQLKHIAYLSLDPKSQDEFDLRLITKETRDSVKGIVICLPDSDYFVSKIPSGRIKKTHETMDNRWVLKDMFETEVPKFTNLVHMAVHFRPPPKALGPYKANAQFKGLMIYNMMDDLFRTLFKFKNGLEELSLHCLPVQAKVPSAGEQWDPIGFEHTTLILNMLKIKSLKLAYVGRDVWPPTDEPQWKNFVPPNFWVMPIHATIRHLSITCWGFYMVEWTRLAHVQPTSQLPLPNLESLELRGCTFISDLEKDWIMDHKHTLRSIKFDDCAMIYCLQMELDNEFAARSRATRTDERRDVRLQFCPIRWQDWFHKIRFGLPHLIDFQFGSSRIRAPGEEGPVFESERMKGPRFEQKPKFLLGCFPDRYLEMKQNLRRAPWLVDPPPRRYKKRPQCDKADVIALRLLLQHTKQANVEENATSDHAGYVEDLLGHVKPRERA